VSLRYFTEPQRVTLSLDVARKAALFASRVIATVDYSDSSQTRRDKIHADHRVSKIGEEAVRTVFLKYTSSVSEPDYRIYGGKRKSWSPDLVIDGLAVAVKTQTRSAGKRYGLSWTFQSSAARRDPILGRGTAWVCFVEFNDLEASNVECTVFPPCQIHELAFAEPQLLHLKGKKKVVYATYLRALFSGKKNVAVEK
jgi:hypothetical protein